MIVKSHCCFFCILGGNFHPKLKKQAVLVNAIFIMCAVIALSLQQWQNFGIAVFVLAVSCMILKLWDIIEYAIGVICGHLFEILSV